MVCYIAYPKAIRLLADRLEATPEELAAWVWMGPKINGLSAYINANKLDPPPRFYYEDAFCSKNADYISPLMACWFNTDEIVNFEPVDRYITGIALIERWGTQPGIKSKAFIQAKIEEFRLNDHHPIYGGTQGPSTEDHFPPLESGLFLMSEVELIEAEDLNMVNSLHTSQRNKSLQLAANTLAAQWKKDGRMSFSKRKIATSLAASDEWRGMTDTTIERIIYKEW